MPPCFLQLKVKSPKGKQELIALGLVHMEGHLSLLAETYPGTKSGYCQPEGLQRDSRDPGAGPATHYIA